MVLFLSVFIGIALDLAGAMPAVKYYSSKYEHIDVGAILHNRRMVNYYTACLLSNGPCPPEGVELKRILPEALQTNCGRCTEKQATFALRAIKRLKKEYPKTWSQLSEKWDPDDIFVRKFEASFGSKDGPKKTTQTPPLVLNRFGADDEESSDNGNAKPLPPTTTTTTTTIRPNKSTTNIVLTSPNTSSSFSTSTKKIIPNAPSSTPSTTTSTRRTTTAPSPSTTTRISPIPGLIPINTFFTNPPIPIRPLVNLNIGATVSGFVRGLGAIGSRVMETGAEIAEVVIRNIARPLQI